MVTKSKEDESILKTALAFVVLRRRVKAYSHPSNTNDHGSTSNDNAILDLDSINNSSKSSNAGLHDQHHQQIRDEAAAHECNISAAVVTHSQCSQTQQEENYVYSNSISNSTGTSSFNKRKRQEGQSKQNLDSNQNRGPLPFLRNTNFHRSSSRNSSSPSSISAKDGHLRAMFRIALSTALPLYETYMSLLSREERGRFQSQGENTRQPLPSPIYDCKTASCTIQQIQEFDSLVREQSTSPSIQVYAVLDGIISHLATNLNSTLAKDGNAPAHVHDNDNHQNSCHSSTGSIVYKLLIQPILDQISNSSLANGNVNVSVNANSRNVNHPIDDGGIKVYKCLQSILAMCTILHRLVFQNPSISSHLAYDIIKGLCHTLKYIYHGGEDGQPRSRNHGHVPWMQIQMQMQDIMVVNCLILLEEVVSLRLSQVVRREVCTTVNEFGEYVEEEVMDTCRVSEVSGEILTVVNGILGGGGGGDDESLILPVPIQEMAGFYVRHETMSRSKGGGSSMRGGMQMEGGYGGLGAGSKMMLRISLFDLVQKLTSHHLG